MARKNNKKNFNKMDVFTKIVNLDECISNMQKKKIFNEINSTTSQFHQPPQLNSW